MTTVFFFLLTYFISQNSADGADADAPHQLIENAKKEGRLVFYTSVETEFARVLTGGFEAKYSFIKTDVFRSTHDKIFSRLNVERKAGSFAADVLSVGEFETYHMQKRGLLTPYKASSSAVYPEGFKDPDGYWTDFYDNLMVSAYNITRVKLDELPKSYEDLLQPRWRRRMVLDRNEDRWFANMLHHMGENRGMEFMRALAKQDVAIRSGRSLITQLLAAGEFDLQIVAYWYRPYLMKKQGAPVDWFSVEPAFVALHPISIVERAPHLNAAKLFVEYVLSEEGQRLLAKRGREPARPGIRPQGYPNHLKVVPSRVDLAEKLADYTRRFESLFVK
jgi:iron(III) transport system substrate-binding protein